MGSLGSVAKAIGWLNHLWWCPDQFKITKCLIRCDYSNVNFSAFRVVTFLSTYHNQPVLNYLFGKIVKKTMTLRVYFQYYLMLTQAESMCQIFNFLPNGWSKLTNVWDGSHMFCSTLIILLFVFNLEILLPLYFPIFNLSILPSQNPHFWFNCILMVHQGDRFVGTC